jgi:hypothetical protein
MFHMLRRIFNSLTASSLLLLGICGGLWAWSYFSTAYLDYSGEHTMWNLQSVNGVVRFVRNDFRVALPSNNSHWRGSMSDPPLDRRALKHVTSMFVDEEQVHKWMGFRFAQTKPPRYQDGPMGLLQTRVVVIPDWPIVALFAIVPALWSLSWIFGRMRRRRKARTEERRAAKGRCPKCGYVLAGISSDACPECGAALNSRPEDSSPPRTQRNAEGVVE